MASGASPNFRPLPGMNRWTFEPLLFILPWALTLGFALSFFLVHGGPGWDTGIVVAIAVTLWGLAAVAWAWMRHATRAPGARQSP